MKEKKKWMVRAGALALTAVCLGTGAALAATGGQSDPLITLSYLNDTALPSVVTQVEEKAAARQSELSKSFTDQITQYRSDMEAITGTGSGFEPDGQITREQLATILYRYADFLGLDTSAAGALSQFSDGDKVSAWAEEAMQWAVGSGLLTGKGNGTVDPTGNATRAEVAAILQRMVAMMVK